MAVTIWERYLEYASALGVAREVERQLEALSPWSALEAPWPGAPHGLIGFDLMRRFRRHAPGHLPSSVLAHIESPQPV
jgi:hypothetical protein